MKVSEITPEYIADYARVDEPDEITLMQIQGALTAAIEYAKSYTGLNNEQMDEHEDITIAVLIIATDMYDNRNLYQDYKFKETNKTVECILGMHSINLL